MIVVETGIGYFTGIFAPHKAFESYACMHAYQGLKGIGGMDRDLDQHVVIPNAYDLGEFTHRAKKDDYLLFMGRVIREKGIDIAVEVAERTGKRLVIAGPKDTGGPSTGGYRLPRRSATSSAPWIGSTRSTPPWPRWAGSTSNSLRGSTVDRGEVLAVRPHVHPRRRHGAVRCYPHR